MNKKLSRYVLLLLSFTLLLGSLAGCGKKNAASDSTEKVEIEFWYGLGGNLGISMEEKIKQFNESQDKYVVKGVVQGNYTETYQKMQAALAAKNAPSIAILDANQSYNLASKGVLEDLNKFTKKDNDFNEDDYIEVFYDQGKNKDTLFALPSYGTTQVMYYNKQIFKDNNMDADKVLDTWEGLASAAEKLTLKEGNQVVRYGWEPMYGSLNLMDSALSNNGKVLSDDGTKVLINSKEWVDVWNSFRKWIHEDKTMRIHYGGQGWEYWYSTIDDVMNDKSAGYTGSSGDQGDLDFNKLGAHPQPAWSGSEAKPIAETLHLVMPKGNTTEEQQGAYEFMKFFTSPEVTADWSTKTGYVAVRKSAADDANYKAYAEKNPQILVPFNQALSASAPAMDVTGGLIYDALNIAADKVLIENIDAKIALDEACKVAQKELDKVFNK